jgi:hypothetical protein
MKISKADLSLKMKKYGNEAILHVFFDIFIHESQANLRLKWKKWEMFVLCILIANKKKPYRHNKTILLKKIPIKRIESLIDIKR